MSDVDSVSSTLVAIRDRDVESSYSGLDKHEAAESSDGEIQKSSLSESLSQPDVGCFQLTIARIRQHPLIVALALATVILVPIAIGLAVYFTTRRSSSGPTDITISTISAIPETAGISAAFVSFAIEFYFFPDFAGNLSSPNTFSANLLYNIGNITGQNPFVRVGGNTQDYALYNASLTTATTGEWNYSRSHNYPIAMQYGDSFFESYQTWPGIKFSHGFNMGLANTPEGWESLISTVPLVCKALSHGNLQWWEYGNEPDLYVTSPPRSLRHDPWNSTIYLDEWNNGTDAIKRGLKVACPQLAESSAYGYIGPSVSANFVLNLTQLFGGVPGEAGMNSGGLVKEISLHNYMGKTTDPHVSLQDTLMNHANIRSAMGVPISKEIAVLKAPLVNSQAPNTPVPIILNEANSLMLNTFGPRNLVNVFGDALWMLDYMLMGASIGLSRMQMQLGTDFRYSSWQPITTPNVTMGTLPPYYGNIAVAAMIGNITEGKTVIASEELPSDYESAYSAYVDGSLKRVALINMHEFNTTVWADGEDTNKTNTQTRPSKMYQLKLDDAPGVRDGMTVSIQRLMAAGSDVHKGISWDGWSYEYELDEGRPVRLANVTVGETAVVRDGTFSVTVPDSSAVILSFVS